MAACSFNIALLDSIKIGPWGDKGTPNYDVRCADIMEVIVFWEEVVNGLEIAYYDDNGDIKICIIGSKVGEQKKWELRRGEYINGVSGSYQNCISDLEFKINKKRHGPFAPEGGESFTVDVTGGKIVGFFGRAGTKVNSIGFYLAAVSNTASVTVK